MTYSSDRKRYEKERRKNILQDRSLNTFLAQYIKPKKKREEFISRCLLKVQTRKMLLRLQWYMEIAKDTQKVKFERVALPIIFLFAMAEGLAKSKENNKKMQSWLAIKSFFKEITQEDKTLLETKIHRSLASNSANNLTLKSIVSILYQVRNDAVHGEKFWGFFLADEDDVDKGMTLMTSGQLGKKDRKRKEILELTLTIQELFDIFARTGIENISKVLK